MGMQGGGFSGGGSAGGGKPQNNFPAPQYGLPSPQGGGNRGYMPMQSMMTNLNRQPFNPQQQQYNQMSRGIGGMGVRNLGGPTQLPALGTTGGNMAPPSVSNQMPNQTMPYQMPNQQAPAQGGWQDPRSMSPLGKGGMPPAYGQKPGQPPAPAQLPATPAPAAPTGPDMSWQGGN